MWSVWAGVLVHGVVVGTVIVRAQSPSTSLASALPPNASGADIYRAACMTCHGPDGAGSPSSVVGFDLPLPNGHDFPDFNDCPTATVEPLPDWVAVVTRGGPIRGLDRHMPAFGDALSPEQIESVVEHLWSFCRDRSWPRGDLNLPRAFFTEKAFPENEAVWTTAIGTGDAHGVSNRVVYEHRIGSRNWYEVVVPVELQPKGAGSTWSRGLGDLVVAGRRVFYANAKRGSIFAAGAELTLPTGKESLGLGSGYMVYEPLAMWGQMIGANGFLQFYGGVEIPSDRARGSDEGFLRTAGGYTFARDQGHGRAWTPMTELLLAKPKGSSTEVDVVPQLQVSLSKLQHVLLDVGVRIPITERGGGRSTQVMTYVLWDWFDGGLFQFWK